MASMGASVRFASPNVTTCSTASKTLSHEVRKASAVSATTQDAAGEDAPTIFQAVQDQLGLKLDARKTPVDLVIVDSGRKIPVEN
jgi:uncharacterized protein (TIGR03435 family)